MLPEVVAKEIRRHSVHVSSLLARKADALAWSFQQVRVRGALPSSSSPIPRKRRLPSCPPEHVLQLVGKRPVPPPPPPSLPSPLRRIISPPQVHVLQSDIVGFTKCVAPSPPPPGTRAAGELPHLH